MPVDDLMAAHVAEGYRGAECLIDYRGNMDYFKLIGLFLSISGTLVLAIRVTKILQAISFAAKMHDLNFEIQAERARGSMMPNIQTYGSAKHIDIAESTGTKLLILGFSLQIIGGALQLYGVWAAS